MLYFMYETQKRVLAPFSETLRITTSWMEHLEKSAMTPVPKYIKASSELVNQFVKHYPKPNFNIKTIKASDDKTYSIVEETLVAKSFCDLKHFRKDGCTLKQKPLLIVAPLSGHYATLLRDTVKSSLKDFDVYITDWANASEIPVEKGQFGFEDYMEYCEDFIIELKKKYGEIHLLAVCQPTVPVLGTIAYMEKHDPKNSPDSVVLMGGPIDTREAPTVVNEYAMRNDINWFKANVLDVVPFYLQGAGRIVYPGFLQHAGFLSMNLKKHKQASVDFFNHMIQGADLDAKKHKNFYDEYNAVLDLDAKFYIETLENVFMDQKLAKGTLMYKNTVVSLSDIKNVRVLAVEGELDDISGAGQTHCVIKLTENLTEDKKLAVVAEKVGHYGLFSGNRWRTENYPKMRNFIYENKYEIM